MRCVRNWCDHVVIMCAVYNRGSVVDTHRLTYYACLFVCVYLSLYSSSATNTTHYDIHSKCVYHAGPAKLACTMQGH